MSTIPAPPVNSIDKPKSEWKQNMFYLASLGILSFAALTLGKSLGKDAAESEINSLKNELAVYKDVNKMNLPQLVIDLDSVISNLNRSLSNSNFINLTQQENDKLIKSNSKLSFEVDSLITKTKNLSINYNNANSKLQELSLDFKRLISKSYTLILTEGDSKRLANNNLLLGVKSIYSGWVNFSLNNEEKKLDVGHYLEENLGNQIILISLLKVEYNGFGDKKSTCTFEYSILKE